MEDSFARGEEAIFVQIASFRDPELLGTVRNLFDQAEHPERIFVGICQQYLPGEDVPLEQKDFPFPDQVRMLSYSVEDALGAGWGRSQAQSLCQRERYTLQIDAHMRFVKGWDGKLIHWLSRCGAEKSVLSASLPGFRPPETIQDTEGYVGFTFVKGFSVEGKLHLEVHGGLRLKSQAGPDPFPGAFVVGNFIFAESRVFERVPVDPHIIFHGDELTYSARLWTHGYDIYQPPEVIAYHQWVRDGAATPYKRRAGAKAAEVESRIRGMLGMAGGHFEGGEYGLGEVRSLASFWRYAGINPADGTIMPCAARGRWPRQDEITDGPIGSGAEKRARIFVQIAAYRDAELIPTLRNMFEQAEFPERLSAGVCLQYGDGDLPGLDLPDACTGRVRVVSVAASDSRGVCWARSLAQALWDGEDFVLMLDSHMRFVKHWDSVLLREWASCADERAILSCYPPGYSLPDNVDRNPKARVMVAKPFTPEGIIRFNSRILEVAPPRPIPGYFVAGGFTFLPSPAIHDVPYDPFMYFDLEEMQLSVRFFTHGWNVYSPAATIVFHLYRVPEAQDGRRTHWDDHPDWSVLRKRAKDRFYAQVLGTDPADTASLLQLERFGLGRRRSVRDFEAATGVDFRARTVRQDAA